MGGRGGGVAGRPPSKICQTYPTMMKLGTVIPDLKKIKKIYESRDKTPEFYWHHHFFIRNSQALLYQEIQIQIAFWYIISFFLTFLESSKIFLINLDIILMMSAKMATLGLLKITVFWNRGYDVIISVNDATNKSLSRDSNYIVNVFIQSLVTLAFLWRYHNLNFIGIWSKNPLFWKVVLVKVQ